MVANKGVNGNFGGSGSGSGCEIMDLPPGFRFHPTDEEIITHYLTQKVLNSGFTAKAMGEADFNKCEPWDLPSMAKMGEKDWYFFCHKDRKYPTGTRTNRATESGYWKATGKDKEIYRGKGRLVGMKKTLVFYKGRAPKGHKTNWIMHEYRLVGPHSNTNLDLSSKDEWAVCRVFHKNNEGVAVMMTATAPRNSAPMTKNSSLLRMNSSDNMDDLLLLSTSSPVPQLPPLSDSGEEFKVMAATPQDGADYYATFDGIGQKKQQYSCDPFVFTPQNLPSDSTPGFVSKSFPHYPPAIHRGFAGDGYRSEAEQSMVTAELGYMDVNMEISSAVNFEGPTNFECLWNY